MDKHTIIGLRVLPGGRVDALSSSFGSMSPSSKRRPFLIPIRGGKEENMDDELNRGSLKDKLESIISRLKQVEGLLYAVSRLND